MGMSKCKVCRDPYLKRSMRHKLCGKEECAIKFALKEKQRREEREAKAERKAVKERKEKLKTRSDYIKEVQIAFNAYIRERDRQKPCICCGVNLQSIGASEVGGGFDCGHYRSVGSAPHLRFNENNAHGQRKQCNRWGAGRAVDYRIGLVKRIGLEAVEALEADNTPRKWTIEELKAIKAHYRAKIKDLKESGDEFHL
jgi:intein/homing endonuclease